MDFIGLLAMLVFAHFLFDFPLQGYFLATAKNHTTAIDGIPWALCLFAHSFLHAFAVAWITGSYLLGFVELVLHVGLDYTKSDDGLSFSMDQACHLAAKFAYALFVVWMGVELP